MTSQWIQVTDTIYVARSQVVWIDVARGETPVVRISVEGGWAWTVLGDRARKLIAETEGEAG